MTKAELQTFVTSLLDNNEMEQTLFDTFLNVAQSYWENRRPWVALRAEDSSQTVTAGGTYETQKDLPSDFRKWYTRFPVVLTDASGNPQQYLAEVPINMKGAYKDDASRFYCDYRNKKLYVCGSRSQSLTLRQYYIRRAALVSSADAQTWELDPWGEYTQILGLSVAVYHKLGVDYDIVNNAQGSANAALAKQIFSSMEEWDAELAESALNGQDYGGGGGSAHFGADGLSGRLSSLG